MEASERMSLLSTSSGAHFEVPSHQVASIKYGAKVQRHVSEWTKEHIGGLQTVHCKNIILCECIVLGLIEAPSKREMMAFLVFYDQNCSEGIGHMPCLWNNSLQGRNKTKSAHKSIW